MKLARELPPSIGAALYAFALLAAVCGGAGLALCGAWCATHPESGASLELARTLTYAGLALAVAGAVAASQPWRRS
jgi:hypothetical protein